MSDSSNIDAKIRLELEPHESYLRFKRQSWWQVTFPVILTILLALTALILLIVFGGRPASSIVADYSLILLIPLWCTALAFVLVTLGGLAYVFTVLIRETAPRTAVVQRLAKDVYQTVDRVTDKIAGVLINIRSAIHTVTTYLRKRGIIPAQDETPN